MQGSGRFEKLVILVDISNCTVTLKATFVNNKIMNVEFCINKKSNNQYKEVRVHIIMRKYSTL